MAPTAPPLGIAQHLPPGGLIAIAWSSVILAGAFVTARTTIRITRNQQLGWDDYLIYLTYGMLVVMEILQTIQTPHLYYVTRAYAKMVPTAGGFMMNARWYQNSELAMIGLFWTVLWGIKASFLALYWRLFQGLRRYKKWWMGVGLFSFLAYLGCWIASVNVCHSLGSGTRFGPCETFTPLKVFILISFSTTVDVLSDIMIMCLPLHMLYHVRLAMKQKLGLAAVFSLGTIIIVVAIARASQISQRGFEDAVLLAVWNIIECTVSVIVACLPPFKLLIESRRGSSPDRHIRSSSDLLSMHGYRGATRVQSHEDNPGARDRPNILPRASSWLHQTKKSHGGRKEATECPKTSIQVRSDYVR